MEYICVKCKEHLTYEQAFNAHTHIIGKQEKTVYIESTDDERIGERCQICTKKCGIKSLFFFEKILQSLI